MDPAGAVVLFILLGLVVAWFLRWNWKVNRAEKAAKWPSTAATMQSGGMEVVSSSRYGDVSLPCFAFSYEVAGEYYSGRFSLIASGDRADGLTKALIDHKLTVHYDPQHPATWYIAESSIEGCELHQKLEADLVRMYPKG